MGLERRCRRFRELWSGELAGREKPPRRRKAMVGAAPRISPSQRTWVCCKRSGWRVRHSAHRLRPDQESIPAVAKGHACLQGTTHTVFQQMIRISSTPLAPFGAGDDGGDLAVARARRSAVECDQGVAQEQPAPGPVGFSGPAREQVRQAQKRQPAPGKAAGRQSEMSGTPDRAGRSGREASASEPCRTC